MKKYPEKKIGDIAETTSGGTPSRSMSQYFGGNIPWIKSGELNDGLILEHSEAITEEALKNSSAKLYPKGTLVLALYGATVGKVGIVNFETASNQAVCAIFPSGEVDKKFLFWFLRQKRLDFIRISFGGAQPNISQTVVKKTMLPVPPLAVQNQVVTILDEYETSKNLIETEVVNEIKGDLHKYNIIKTGHDKIVENNSTNLELCQELHQSILQDAVSGKLVPQDATDEPASDLLKKIKTEKEKLVREKKIKEEKSLSPILEEEIPYDLPKGWEWVRLGNITLKVQDGTHFSPKIQYTEPSSNRYMYITSKNIKETGIDTSTATYIDAEVHKSIWQRCNPELFDILMIKDGAITGRVAINNINEEFSLLSSVALIKTDRTNVENKFLLYYLRSPIGYANVTGRMSGSAITRIILEKIKNTIIPLPPLLEQRRIVKRVDQLMKLCYEIEEKLEENQNNSKLLMEAVLKEAFHVNNVD